jgi:hypothetical protein
MKGKKPGLLVNLGLISMLLDPDPHSQYGSGSAFSIRMRIQDGQRNMDPCGSGLFKFLCLKSLKGIRIRPNNADPTGTGFATLLCLRLCRRVHLQYFCFDVIPYSISSNMLNCVNTYF